MKVTVATVDIPGYPTFGAGSFSVRARHEGTDGFYALLDADDDRAVGHRGS